MTTTVLVTGGTGFLGRHLLRELLGAGTSVRVLVRRDSPELAKLEPSPSANETDAGGWGGASIEQVIGDVEDPATLQDALAGIEHIYHLAGLVSRHPGDTTAMMRVHVDGTRNILNAARDHGVRRLVLASTSGTIAVSKDPDFVATEDAPYALPVVRGWPYYLSKVYQEQLALAPETTGDLEVVVLNPSLLLGPGDDRGSSTEDIRNFLRRRIPTVPEGGLNFVDVRDAAPAFVRAMADGEPGQCYLLGGPNWTFERFFGRLSRLSKVPAPRLRIPQSWARWGATLVEQLAEWRGFDAPVARISVEMAQHYWYLDASKAEQALGFLARDPQETLLDTIRYVRDQFLVDETDDDWWVASVTR